MSTTTSPALAGVFSVTYTRKQIIIAATDESKTFHPRTEKGQAAADRRIARLVAAGYREVKL